MLYWPDILLTEWSVIFKRVDLLVKENQKEEKRQQILNAALTVFARKGYNPAVLDDVAGKAKVAKGTVYLYFKDKEDLYLSTFLYVIDNLEKTIFQNIKPDMGPFEIMENIARRQIEFFLSEKDYFKIFHNMAFSGQTNIQEKFFLPMRSRILKLQDYLGRVVEQGKKEGSISREIDTRIIVNNFMGMVSQSIQYCNQTGSRSELTSDKIVMGIMKMLKNGIEE